MGKHNGQATMTNKPNTRTNTLWLYGVHPVRAALANPRRKCYRLFYSGEGHRAVVSLAAERSPKLKISQVSSEAFESLLGDDVRHQNIAVEVAPLTPPPWQQACQTSRLLVILDQLQDPHNIGAIIRSCWLFGADGVFMTRRHSPKESAAMAKAASGGIDKVPLYVMTNLSQTLRTLKKNGFFCLGLSGDSPTPLSQWQRNPQDKCVLVLGQEGRGLRHLTAKQCDMLLAIPHGTGASLNVSVACGIALYALTPSPAPAP